MRVKVTAFAVVLSLIGVALLVPTAQAPIPVHWNKGDEVALTGHSFDEEYWTAELSNRSANGEITNMTMSYVNHNDVQAFLLAFKTFTKDGNVSTLPYQLFGLHYKNEKDRDVFIGAVLAFLMAFNDTYNGTGPGQNGMPDPGHEPVYYILPFGIGGTVTNNSYVPNVTAIPAQRIADGHYRFGMRYENMYAKIVDPTNFASLILSGVFPLYIAQFSELTIVYDIQFGKDNTLTVQTFYTLGQVRKLWFFGQEVEPSHLQSNMGIAAIHYVATFGSTYAVTGNTTGNTLNTDIQQPLNEDMNLKAGSPPRKVLDIGLRGKFDLINETSGATVRSGQDARNFIVKATFWDGLLVLWQAGLSIAVMATMAYTLSPDLQARYNGPLDLVLHGGRSFFESTLWYGVSFPQWQGYRVVHDPVYTAYLAPPAEEPNFRALVGLLVLSVFVLVVIAVIAVAVSRRKGRQQLPPNPPPPYQPPRNP